MFADETRPFLQGARLTAWELVRDGIPTTVITESMAGPADARGEIDIVVVGADRIAANGDIANKIGTYTVAVLAHEHEIPFYVAAPLSTIDLATPTATHIPIEERDQREVTHFGRLAADARRRATSAIRRSTSRRTATSPASSRETRHHSAPPYSRRRCAEAQRVRRTACVVRETMLLAHRDLLRRDRGGRRRRDRRSRRSPWRSRSNVVASQVDDPSRVGRRRPRAGVAAARARHLRRRRSGARRCRRRLDAIWARSRSRGARPRRVAARRRGVRQGAGLGARHAARAGAPPGRPHRVARAGARRAAAAGGGARRVGRTHQPVSRPGARALSVDRPDARRCGGGGVRQGGEAARPGLSGRTGHRPAGARGQRSRVRLPACRG